MKGTKKLKNIKNGNETNYINWFNTSSNLNASLHSSPHSTLENSLGTFNFFRESDIDQGIRKVPNQKT